MSLVTCGSGQSIIVTVLTESCEKMMSQPTSIQPNHIPHEYTGPTKRQKQSTSIQNQFASSMRIPFLVL